jgi:hypothetical protein
MWLTGTDIGSSQDGRSEKWKKARDELPQAIAIGQAVVAQRLKVGVLWVSIDRFITMRQVFMVAIVRIDGRSTEKANGDH